MDFFREKAIIKFCEPKLVIFPLYEFLNSISSFAYLFVARQLYIYRNKNVDRIANCLNFVAIGSFLLHSTGLLVFQYLDEFAMVILMNTIIEILMSTDMKKEIIYYNYFLFGVYTYLRNYAIFLVIFKVQVFTVIAMLAIITPYRPVIVNYTKDILILLFFAYLCWTVEQNFCHLDKTYAVMHSLWHFFSALAIFPLGQIIKNI